MVARDDLVAEGRDAERCRIDRIARAGICGLELVEDFLQTEPTPGADIGQASLAAAAIVDPEALEDAGAGGLLRHQLADRRRSSRLHLRNTSS